MSFATRFTQVARNALAAALLVAATHAVGAGADTEPFHWGYSATFGRGTYVLGDDAEVDVYRGAFKVGLRAPRDEPGGRPADRKALPGAKTPW